jgi:phosphatidate phosphatase APP1
MAQSGSAGSSYGYGYGYGGSDPGQYADREPGARRKKLAGFAKSVYQAGVATASEIRNQYDNTRIRGVVDVDDSAYKVSIPGSFPDVSIVTKGDEQMVLFPSYAARHVRQFRDDDRQPSAYSDGERREDDLSEEDYWRNEWARMEDKKAVVDVDVRGWVYAPHKGPMTRKNRVLIGLARRLSGVPQQTHQPYGQSESLRTGHEAREDAREQQKIDKEAEMIERRGQAEKDAAVKGGYSETPKDEDSEGEGLAPSLRSRSASGSATPMSGASSPRLPARSPNNGAAGVPVDLTEAELAVANANLMARLGPFLTTPLVELPVTLFFYNDDQSVSRTVMTNDAGHFYIRAALDFVPTHVRVLANEKLSAVEPVDIISDNGVSVISDIDDTIKKSSISMGAREIFRNTFIRDLKDLTVAGVKEWYGELHRMGVRFHYCSNSPWQLFPVIATFFGLAGLPPGSLHLKQYSGMLQGIFEPVAERKKGTLEKILRDFPRRRFILVGDSGEADLEVYTELALAHPRRILAIFIRDVTTPEQTGYFDSSFNGSASAGTPSRQRPTDAQAHSRKDSGSDHPDRRPALPSRATAPAPRQESPAEEDLIDFSDEPQNITAKEDRNLDKSWETPSPSTAAQDQVPRKKPPPPRPSKPAALRGESSGSLKTGAPNNESGPPTLGKRPPASQYKSATAHPLVQTQNLSAQSLGKSPTLPPRKPSTGSNSNAGSTMSNTNSSNAQSPSAAHSASSSKQPPPPPPPRRRGTPSLINASPRQQALRRAASNSDIDSLNLDSSAAVSTPRPGAPNRTGTASTFDSILGSTTGHTLQQGGQNMPLNKKLELWLRRLERAHETLEREGVRLYTWRRGDDVVSEAVGIVKEATENTRETDKARR